MKQAPYRAAIFDLDGTLLNTAPGILAAITYTATKLHLPLPPADALCRICIGPPVEASFAALFGLQGEALAAACRCFRERYATHELKKAAPYEGVVSVLQTLQALSVLCGVATYKQEHYTLPLMAEQGLTPYFAAICGARENECKADILSRALQALAVSPSEAVMIGDTASDSEAALAVGCDFIGVTYGFGFRENAAKIAARARGFANTPTAILRFF